MRLRYFAGGSDWWLVELDLEDRIGFAYVPLSGHRVGAEWGYVDLADLADLAEVFIPGQVTAVGGGGIVIQPPVIEWDLHWTPRPAAEVIPEL